MYGVWRRADKPFKMKKEYEPDLMLESKINYQAFERKWKKRPAIRESASPAEQAQAQRKALAEFIEEESSGPSAAFADIVGGTTRSLFLFALCD